MTCTECGKHAEHITRCEEHYRCDDCGTKDGLCTHCEGVLCDPCHTIRVEKRVEEFDGDTEGTVEITCPHCGYEEGDSWEHEEGEDTCGDCGRRFNISRYTEVTYTTTKADTSTT